MALQEVDLGACDAGDLSWMVETGSPGRIVGTWANVPSVVDPGELDPSEALVYASVMAQFTVGPCAAEPVRALELAVTTPGPRAERSQRPQNTSRAPRTPADAAPVSPCHTLGAVELLDPKLDLVFKLLLCRDEDLLKSMIEAVLQLPGPIQALQVLNPD